MFLRRTVPLASLLMLSSTLCLASGDGGHRQHGAHVHGIAQLNLAIEGKNVLLELMSPSMNIVGFEHLPSSDEQRQAVHEAAEKLEGGGSLFEFSKDAGCTMVAAEIESVLLGDGHHEGHDDEEHSEFEARYQFTCSSPQKLKSLTVNLFTAFPGFEKIETQILTGRGQTGAELTAGNNRVDL